MRCVTRGIALLSTALAALAVALPAAGAEGRSVKGVVVSLTQSAVAVKDAKSVVTTCARADRSPSLDGVSVGDRVQAACARVRGHLVLVKIRRLRAADGATANNTEPTKFGGVVTALTDASITVHDGDRDLTCSLGAGSPSTGAVKVGQHVKIACANGTLVAVAPVVAGQPGHAYEGTVTAVGAGSISVHTEHGDATCTVADGSPSLAEVKVGDRVLVGCKAGSNQLVILKKLPTDPHNAVGAAGTVSAVSATSLTVHTDGGAVTCSVADGSPSVAEVHVGDPVKIGCVDGVLRVLVTAAQPAPPAGDHHQVTTAGGTLSALSDTSVTVHSGEKGDVTCSVGPSSPRLGDFHVGDHVGMACVDGVLAKLVRV
jgi:hypothetical protein